MAIATKLRSHFSLPSQLEGVRTIRQATLPPHRCTLSLSNGRVAESTTVQHPREVSSRQEAVLRARSAEVLKGDSC